jgi:hypothetical protein
MVNVGRSPSTKRGQAMLHSVQVRLDSGEIATPNV